MKTFNWQQEKLENEIDIGIYYQDNRVIAVLNEEKFLSEKLINFRNEDIPFGEFCINSDLLERLGIEIGNKLKNMKIEKIYIRPYEKDNGDILSEREMEKVKRDLELDDYLNLDFRDVIVGMGVMIK